MLVVVAKTLHATRPRTGQWSPFTHRRRSPRATATRARAATVSAPHATTVNFVTLKTSFVFGSKTTGTTASTTIGTARRTVSSGSLARAVRTAHTTTATPVAATSQNANEPPAR